MPVTRETILTAISDIALPQGGTLGQADLIRALTIDQETVRFVLEVENAATAQAMAPVEAEARARLERIPGVAKVQIVMTAPAKPAPPKAVSGQGAAPSLKIGGHPTPQAGPQAIPGVRHIIAVGSGKGGVGKSTVTSNLAVALARAGRKVGLLDADIYGPSQPRMMGVSGRPASPDGQRIDPMHAHGVTVMSIGLMLKEGEALVWRGPMLMGALQQLLQQVNWGELDVLLIDLPPGTGDVQLSLCQKAPVTGAIIVSTPQDVALLDARRAIDMFGKLKTPVLGLVENMSTYICPKCGHEAHLFGHGGVAAEAEALNLPFLGALPLELEVRLAGDSGRPVALGDGAVSEAYARLADRLVQGGIA
ncbi:MAG: Mrp/NBP35 family ATP-binding protein [Paracoccus sp. (in: a-proteobacteria)]|jgi:ATP-binding protein involved in chromosome partitioning|uniref:Iron-sulfur cluster carrier protein n=1 Tax=Paracoccus marcusii TaxID=59779 RepID=A0ABY7USQ6_9RHOB|nr:MULTISPECIES: Mrp/NBP35 family ATP-binding protein [Paracoccus]AZY94818.1 iron-sulfur cluster carrier protein ApbC [Paracoccus sp. Arc7-R13]TNC03844.1 Mrp/NBP35 family ATP-binding protein [Paracoccus marcusii]TYP67134.1 ATP-binding protein involved in chromosome partitioning [Stutzerimonas stutzeri]WDA12976.1 Mrp/NBP35 family ATP-binding protein [Paracoccus marcusii]|tara:strand:- start:1647 stop:2738 length:1092 start_codon:yes stop_codon:yes gene_type:complete